MSENETFIEEVTEEVRRDKLYILLKKYGWAFALAIFLIIGASVFMEFKNNSRIAMAEKLGDSVTNSLSNLENGKETSFDSSQEFLSANSVLRLLFDSKRFEQNFDYTKAKFNYEKMINDQEIQNSFQEFAKFKLLLLTNDDLPAFENLLDELITPDSAYRLLAMEQKVLLKIKNNNWTGAQETLDVIFGDPGLTQSSRSRLNQIQKAIEFGSK